MTCWSRDPPTGPFTSLMHGPLPDALRLACDSAAIIRVPDGATRPTLTMASVLSTDAA